MATDDATPDPAPLVVKAREDGPYKVTGPVVLRDGSGTVLEPSDDRPLALCRCGGSGSRPFCDGTHRTNGFDGTLAR